MPRHSTHDREVTDGPWPLGLNDASDSRFIDDGQVPELLDCEVTLGGGVHKRQGLKWLSALTGTNSDEAVCVLIDFLHDGRVVLGIMNPTTAADVFATATSTITFYALPVGQFITTASITSAVASSNLTILWNERLTAPSVVRAGGRTYIAAMGNILKWDGSSWDVINHSDTASGGSKTWDTGIFGYWTRKTFDGVPAAVSDIRTSGFEREEPITSAVNLRDDDEEGGGGFPKSDLISLYQVGDRQVVLSAYGDKVRYSYPTPYGVGVNDADSAVYGPQDWLEEAWLDLGESGSYDYVTAMIQVQETLYVFKRSSIWGIYGDLSPGGLRVQKLHDGVGTRHSQMVAPAGDNGLVFFDMNTSSLWTINGGELANLWNQRIKTDLRGSGNATSFVLQSGVEVYDNKAYCSIPTDGTPEMRTYVTDLVTGAITLWSFGSSYMRNVEFYGNYGMVCAPRIDSEDPFIAWVEQVSRNATPFPADDQTSSTATRSFTGKIKARSLIPSVGGTSYQSDWSAVSPKWRRALLTYSAKMAGTLTLRFNGTETTVNLEQNDDPTQVWVNLPEATKASKMTLDADIPDGATLHRVAMRYWRRR